MKKLDKNFLPDAGLETAIDLLREVPSEREVLPERFPELGLGSAHIWLNGFADLQFLKGFEWI